MRPLLRAAMNGVFAGGIGTTTMTVFMRGTQWVGLYHQDLPPTKITRAATNILGVKHRVSSRQETVLTGVAHWAFGMAGGALFGVISQKIARVPRWFSGLVFGLLVWGISYLGWVPALGILPQPWNQRGTHGLMPMLAHVIYGVTVGTVVDRLEHR